MSKVEMDCEKPPPVRRLMVVQVGDTFARLEWNLAAARRSTAYYGLELEYKVAGELPSLKYQLSKWEMFATLRNLQPNTTYLTTLSTANQCGSTEPAIASFRTNITMLDPVVLRLMPHEFILTLVVLLIWLMIVRHFFRMYSVVAMVNPVTYGGYMKGRGLIPAESCVSSARMATPRGSLVPSAGSQQTPFRRRSSTLGNRTTAARHKQHDSRSSLHQIEDPQALLAGAIDKWRSEAVLARMERMDMVAPMMHSSLLRMRSAHSEIDLRESPRPRRASSASVMPKYSGQSALHGIIPVVRISIEEEDEEQADDKDVDDDNGSGNRFLDVEEDVKVNNGADTAESFSSSSFLRPLQIAAVQTPLLKNDCDQINFATNDFTAQEKKRKISTILLGKATTDIRRCSSPARVGIAQLALLEELAVKEDGNKRHRLSFFRSFRQKQRPSPLLAPLISQQRQMSAVTELTEEESSSAADDDHNDVYGPRDQQPLLQFSRQKNRRWAALVPEQDSRQNSTDSYVTASEYLNRNNHDMHNTTSHV